MAGELPSFTWLQPQSTTYGDSLCNWQHPDGSVIEGTVSCFCFCFCGTRVKFIRKQ